MRSLRGRFLQRCQRVFPLIHQRVPSVERQRPSPLPRLTRSRQQHRRQCNGHRDHSGQRRCPVVHLLQPKFPDTGQGGLHEHGHTHSGRWAGCFVVHHPNTPVGPYVQHLNRCHRRYTNCSVVLDILHGHGNQRWRQRYSHRDHRRQRHRTVGCNLHAKHPFLDQGFGHDHGHTDLKRWNGHVVVDFCNTPCGSLLRHLHGCHQRYTNGHHFCNNLHRHRQQHRRQRHDHGDHPRQRCRSSHRLQPEFTHVDQEARPCQP